MKKFLLFMLILSCVTAFSACAKDTETDSSNTTVKTENNEISDANAENQENFPALELKTWNGTWNSMTALLDAPAFEAAYPVFAENDEEETTAAQVKADYTESYHSDFSTLVIEGSQITFYEIPAASDGAVQGEVLFTGTYRIEGIEPIFGDGYSYAWYKFKTEEEGPYQYLMMLPVESEEEEGFAHWHFRYGDESFEALLAMEHWWPTAIKPQTTAQIVVDAFMKE